MIYFYCKKHREHIWRLRAFHYITLTIRFSNIALPLRIQKYTWQSNKSVEWFVHIFCFIFHSNSYGCNVRNINWPKEWWK